MVNDKYSLMVLGDIAAQKFEKCPILVIVADSDQGKTDTKEIFMRECDTAYEVEPISKAALPASLGMRRISTYIFDDTNGWIDDDIGEVFSMFKDIATKHIIRSQRETKFSKESARIAIAQCIILVNGEQYQEIYQKIKKSGLLKRAIIAFTMQSNETTDYCTDFYENHGCDSANLPYFTDLNIVARKAEDLKDQFVWIKKNFSGFKGTTIKSYAKLLSNEDFNNLKPVLLSTHRHPIVEEIKFKEEKEAK